MDPTSHCTNSGSALLDPTTYMHFTVVLYWVGRGEAIPLQLKFKMHVGCWIQQVTTILQSSRTGKLRPPVQVEGKMHVGCWIQQFTTRVGTVTCQIQQPVSRKQVVGFSCVLNSEVDQLVRKLLVPPQKQCWITGAVKPGSEDSSESSNLGNTGCSIQRSHCANSGDLLDPTTYMHFAF